MQLLPGRRNLARLDMSGEFLYGNSRLPCRPTGSHRFSAPGEDGATVTAA